MRPLKPEKKHTPSRALCKDTSGATLLRWPWNCLFVLLFDYTQLKLPDMAPTLLVCTFGFAHVFLWDLRSIRKASAEAASFCAAV